MGSVHSARCPGAHARRPRSIRRCCCNDPLPPPVVFAEGELGLLEGRRAAIVGTRNATAAGRDTATTLGRQLADADVHVVSGPGTWHRRMRASRRAADRRRAAVRSRSSLPVTTSSTRVSIVRCGRSVAESGSVAVRIAAGHLARGISVPDAQPCHRGAVGGGDRRRVASIKVVRSSPSTRPSSATSH